MLQGRSRDILLGSALLGAVVLTIWFAVGRESQGSASAAPTKRVESPAINPEEQKTMPKEEEAAPPKPEPTSQEGMLREEMARAARDEAMRKFKEEN